MATLQKWIDRAMRLNSVDIIQYPATASIEDANVIIHQIEDYITSAIGEGFFWDILTAETTVVGQSEYTIPVISTGNFNGAPKVESISIKYSSTSDFIPARPVARDVLLQDHDLSWYEVNQSDSDPIFFIADSSVFIYPKPKEAVENGIKFYGIKSLSDVTASTNESDLFGGKIPTKYFYIISDGLKQFIKAGQGKEQEAENCKQIFEKETLPTLVEKLGNRRVGISQRGTPDISIYQ